MSSEVYRMVSLSTALPLVLGCSGLAEPYEGEGSATVVKDLSFDTPSRDDDAADLDAPLQHILSGIRLPQGKVPVLDVARSPSGNGYALLVSNYSLEEGGAAISEMGYREVTVRKSKVALPSGVPTAATQDRVDPKLRSRAERGDGSAPVVVWLNEDPQPPLFLELQRAVLSGAVGTRRERDEYRGLLLDRRQGEISQLQERFIAGRSTFTPGYRCAASPCIMGRILLSELDALERDPNVDIVELLESQGGPSFATGGAIIRATQLEPWWDLGYAGHGVGGNEAVLALLEQNAPNEEHIGFTDGPGTGPRIRSRTKCHGCLVKQFAG